MSSKTECQEALDYAKSQQKFWALLINEAAALRSESYKRNITDYDVSSGCARDAYACRDEWSNRIWVLERAVLREGE